MKETAVETISGGPSSPGRPVPITADLLSDGHLAVGLTPRFHVVPRWGTVADVPDVPDRPLPPIPAYDCLRAPSPPRIDGVLDDDIWARAPWSEPFGNIG